jgi:type II secretory pathway pseudopilin PulG
MLLNRRPSGWTLVEAMVALFLAAIVFAIVSRTLANTSAWTSEQTLRTSAQGKLQIVIRELETHLQRTSPLGLALEPSTGTSPSRTAALLVLHCQDTASITTTVKYEPSFRVYRWDVEKSELRVLDCPPGVAVAAPTALRPQIPSAAELATLSSSTFAGARLLADGVSKLDAQVLDGPLVQLDLEVQFYLSKRGVTQSVRAHRIIHLRNRA